MDNDIKQKEVMKTHGLPRTPMKRMEKKASVESQGKKGEARFF